MPSGCIFIGVLERNEQWIKMYKYPQSSKFTKIQYLKKVLYFLIFYAFFKIERRAIKKDEKQQTDT